MQALQAPEACISDAHQRDRVRAFIVVMDGQMPKVEKKLLMFSHLALRLPLEKRVESDPGRMSANLRPGITGFLSLDRHRCCGLGRSYAASHGEPQT